MLQNFVVSVCFRYYGLRDFPKWRLMYRVMLVGNLCLHVKFVFMFACTSVANDLVLALAISVTTFLFQLNMLAKQICHSKLIGVLMLLHLYILTSKVNETRCCRTENRTLICSPSASLFIGLGFMPQVGVKIIYIFLLKYFSHYYT